MQNNNYIDNILLNSQQPQFSNVAPIQYGNLQAAYQGYDVAPSNIPAVNELNTSGQPSQAVLDAINNSTINNSREQELRNNWGFWGGANIQNHPELSRFLNIPKRFIFDNPMQIGTGLYNEAGRLIYNPKETLEGYKNAAVDYLTDLGYRSGAADARNFAEQVNNYPRYAYNIGKDVWNAFQGTIPALNTERIGKVIEDIRSGNKKKALKDSKDIGYDTWRQIADYPLITGLVAAPNLTTGLIAKGGKGTLNLAEKAGVPVGKISQDVARAVQAVEARFNRDSIKLGEKADKIAKADERDLKIVLDYIDGKGAKPKSLDKLYNDLRDFNKDYVKYNIDDNALVNPQEMSALQYVQRQTGRTLQDIRREVTPQLEKLQEGITDPRLSFRNKLSDFEHEVNKFRKDTKNKDFLKDSKPITELSKDEFSTLSKYFTPEELRAFYDTNASIGSIKSEMGKAVREAWYPEATDLSKFKDAIYQENMAKLAGLAEQTGNQTLKHLYDGLRLGEEDRGIYTMAGADIPEKGLIGREGRRLQGASSSREYGTASTTEVAKAYRNIHQFLDDIAAQRSRDEIGRNILSNGTIDGVHKLVGDGVKAEDIRYINPDVLANGTYTEAIRGATNKAVEGFIPIDKYNLKALETLTAPSGGLQGVLKDILGLYKEAALASGTYLGGNLISGVYGTILNSGSPQGLIKDVVSAIGSKGALAKEIGTFRRVKPRERSYNTKLAQGISWLGGWAGSRIAPRIDAIMNNMFSEINAHSQLRKMGIKTPDRLNSLQSMSKTRLGNFINDNRLASMLNNKFRIIPRGMTRDIAGLANPFIDWIDTSTQVTAKMLVDHPILLGAASAKLFGEIGFNRELQNRLKLKVYTDKPLVTYIPDDKTGGQKEITMSFLPQMTPLEFLADPKKLVMGSSGTPVLTALYEATKGKNAYGKPLRRSFSNNSMMSVIGNDRYIVNPKTQQIEQVTETQGDEVLSTAIRSLMSPVNIWNKTIAPLGAGIINAATGSNYTYYQPYAQSILGSFETGQPEIGGAFYNALRPTGDPTKTRNINDIIRGLGTIYERQYYPVGQLTGNKLRRIKRAGAGQARRIYGDEE